MKTCTKCGIEKLATAEYFPRCRSRKDGFDPRCKDCHKAYRRANIERIAQGRRAWYQANREHSLEYARKYRESNKEQAKEYNREYGQANKERCRERSRKRYWGNASVRINLSASSGIYKSLNRDKNGYHWESLVGYSLEDLMNHLKSQFTKGMTWDNYGEWHIDHIRPKADFKFASLEDPEFLECWSLWNLQPMWGPENQRKNAKCEQVPLPLLTETN